MSAAAIENCSAAANAEQREARRALERCGRQHRECIGAGWRAYEPGVVGGTHECASARSAA